MLPLIGWKLYILFKKDKFAIDAIEEASRVQVTLALKNIILTHKGLGYYLQKKVRFLY